MGLFLLFSLRIDRATNKGNNSAVALFFICILRKTIRNQSISLGKIELYLKQRIVLRIMKRYRVLRFSFDTRANLLDIEIKDDWEEHIKEQHRNNHEQIKLGLQSEYGINKFDTKLERFKELGMKPISILSYHNALLNQIRHAYVHGQYFPALTGACVLGERILNHLVLELREDYQQRDSQLEENTENGIYTHEAFSNWNIMLSALDSWGVLKGGNAEHPENSTDPAKSYHELKRMRMKYAHFGDLPSMEILKSEALEAIKLFQNIVASLFSAHNNPDYFLAVDGGECYLKKELENEPFFQKFYLPNSFLVSPYHKIADLSDFVNPTIEDREDLDDREISDEEFIALRVEGKFFLNKNAQS